LSIWEKGKGQMPGIATKTLIEKDKTFCIFGFNLISVKSFKGSANPENIMAVHRRNLSRFLSMFKETDRKILLAIRSIVIPYQSNQEGGHIKITLIVKFQCKGREKDYQTEAEKLCSATKMMLRSNFDYYTWSEIGDPNELDSLLNPINWDDAFLGEIRRKQENVILDISANSDPLGFAKSNQHSQNKANPNSINFIHPFSPYARGLEQLFHNLIQGSQIIVLTSMIEPTALSEADKKFLQDQIAYAEGYMPQKTSSVRVFENRAKSMSRELLKQYLMLNESCFFLTFTIGATQPIDPMILESIGVSITEPFGFYQRNDDTFQFIGGHNVYIPEPGSALKNSQRRMAFLSHHVDGSICAPDEQSHLKFLFDNVEATNMFYLPINIYLDLPGLDSHQKIERSIPHAVAALNTGSRPTIRLGTNQYFGFQQDVQILDEARQQHTYIVGQTGTGKTTLLKTMVQADLKSGKGLAVIDPHGEMYQDLLCMIPENRQKDVVLLDPSDREFPVGFNLLEVGNEEEREYIIKEMRAILKRYISEYFVLNSGEYYGPVFWQHVQNNMLLATSDIENPSTIIEFLNIFQSEGFWKRWLPLKWTNPILTNWIEEGLPNTRYNRTNNDGARMGDYFSSKFLDFVNDPRLAMIFAQPYSTIDFDEIITKNKILLVNLSKGLLGEASSSMLGMILMAKLNIAFMNRRKLAGNGSKLPPFYLYVDEFQSIATENFSILLAEARKFGLGLVLANQYIRQITDYKIRDAIFGNVATIIAFRLGIDDAQIIESQFLPEFNFRDLCNLPNYSAVMRTNIDGKRTSPCNLQTVLPEISQQNNHKEKIVQYSREQYGMPKDLAQKFFTSASSKKRIDVNRTYWEKEDTPSEQLIRNIDIKTLLGISHFSQENQDKVLDRIEKEILDHLVYWLIYRINFSKHQTSKILGEIKNSNSRILEDIQGSIDRFFKPQLGSKANDIIGVTNAIVKDRIMANEDLIKMYSDEEDRPERLKDLNELILHEKWKDATEVIQETLMLYNKSD
jgi:hypothetical protein